ncbi:hypothetical protein F2P56_013110 [Juglans regia]|uniref:Uncharacterized protein LOC108984198 n=2 Tax=Juglans regia TaxID=51240 RepID=A0A2I4DWU8_JUGRE|nr:uncharacterized protein LOC108984198 [Juglans regia]KAF5469005.1 hypothetical protein F2P56_013110 [Juglans regia]
MSVNLFRMGEQYISLRVGDGVEQFLLNVIYAKCTRADRCRLWDELCAQSMGLQLCMYVGDFNIIRNDSERCGGRPRLLGAMEDFNNWIQQGGLIQMASKGSVFSWCNGQHGLARSWAWLDHVLIEVSFLSVFPNAICSYLSRSTSDHAPMCIEFKQDLFSYGPAPFRFQQMWVEHQNFLDCVRQAWESRSGGSAIQNLIMKLKQTKVALCAWNKRVFGHTVSHIVTLEERVEELELKLQLHWEEDIDRELQGAILDLAIWRHREEIRLSQMAKLKWKVDGDRNSKFFHACLANKRRKRVLEMCSNEVVYTSPESIHQGAVDYFSNFLQGVSPVENPNLEGLIDSVISGEENASLVRAPSLDEVLMLYLLFLLIVLLVLMVLALGSIKAIGR